MGVGLIDDHERQGLLKFLRRREAKNACVELFAELHKKFDTKRGEITLAKTPSYDLIVDSFDAALSKGLVKDNELSDFLDRVETAGRQHVLLFNVPTKRVTELNEALLNPLQPGSDTSLTTYWEPPASPFARVTWAESSGTMTKVITKREYYVAKPPVTEGTKQITERELQSERSAVILKLHRQKRLFQMRIPVLEDGPDETATSLWKLANKIFQEHLSIDLLNQMQLFPLSDAFHQILENFDDFILTQEREDDGDYYGTRGRRRALEGETRDLRQKEDWKHDDTPRLRLDGSWKINETRHLDCRMHY
jgi:hypothetical protein